MFSTYQFYYIVIFSSSYYPSIYNETMIRFINRLKRRFLFNVSYFGNPPWDTGIPVPELMHFISEHNAGRALDLGCGTGTNMQAFLEAGWEVDGVDLAYLAIRKASEKIQKYLNRGHVFASDVTNINFLNGRYDLVYDIGCYHGLDPKGRSSYIANLDRLLQKEGYYLIYSFYKTSGADIGIDDRDINQLTRFMSINKRLESTDDRGRAAVFIEFRRNN